MTEQRVLAFAYACEPGKGSEPAAGWTWARMLAGIFDTTIVTRANNRTAVEEALAQAGEANRLRFVYVDLPHWAAFWKRGQRGVRLYYLLWQLAALRRARELHRREPYDLVWHLTLANAWLGSVAGLVGPRFVYGPIGGGGSTPVRLLPTLGIRGTGYELVRAIVRAGCRRFNPFARLAWRRASLILVQNDETLKWLPGRHREKCREFQHATLEEDAVRRQTRGRSSRTAIFVGRLLPWKGVSFALDAIALAPGWRLIVCGSGPDEHRLVARARRKGLDGRVSFLGWKSRPEVFRLMREEADVFLFPSLHDDSPFAVVEAMMAGLPILCLDRGGSPSLARTAAVVIPSGNRRTITESLGSAMREGSFPSPDVIQERAESFLISARASQLKVELQDAGLPAQNDS